MISPTALAPSLAEFLPRQRWFGAKDRTIELVRISALEVLFGEGSFPTLLRVDAEVSLAGTDEASCYQVLLGLRPTGVDIEFLSGHEGAVLGEFDFAATAGTTLGLRPRLIDHEVTIPEEAAI